MKFVALLFVFLVGCSVVAQPDGTSISKIVEEARACIGLCSNACDTVAYDICKNTHSRECLNLCVNILDSSVCEVACKSDLNTCMQEFVNVCEVDCRNSC